MVNRRDDVIQWPSGYAPADCKIHVVNRIAIAAPPSVVWAHLVRATQWPVWYANASNVAIVGGSRDLAEGAQFRWRTFGVGLIRACSNGYRTRGSGGLRRHWAFALITLGWLC